MTKRKKDPPFHSIQPRDCNPHPYPYWVRVRIAIPGLFPYQCRKRNSMATKNPDKKTFRPPHLLRPPRQNDAPHGHSRRHPQCQHDRDCRPPHANRYLSDGQATYLETLIELVEAYEAKDYPMDSSAVSGLDGLKHILSNANLSASDPAIPEPFSLTTVPLAVSALCLRRPPPPLHNGCVTSSAGATWSAYSQTRASCAFLNQLHPRPCPFPPPRSIVSSLLPT